MKQTFGTELPMIGMVHLLPLPGTPDYDEDGGVQKIMEAAVHDAKRLVAGGIDGIQIENQFDRPFPLPREIGPETTAFVSAAVAAIRNVVDLPLGVNIHLNGAHEALAIAHATGASWIRVFAMANAYVSTSGYVEGAGPSLMRYRRAIGAEEVKILGDFHVKHGSHALIHDRPIEEQAVDAEEAGADVVIATGFKTGKAPQPKDLQSVRAAVTAPIFVGSGLTSQNAGELLPHIDGAIVGSYLKEDGDIRKPVDVQRVAAFMDTVRAFRTQPRR